MALFTSQSVGCFPTPDIATAQLMGWLSQGDKIWAMDENELKRLLDANAVETRHHFDDVAATMRRHFEVAAEGLENKIQLVAEAVARVDEKLDRTAADIREEMRRGLGETQAMIKFSHAE